MNSGDFDQVAKYQNWNNPDHRNSLVGGYMYFANPNSWDDKDDFKFVLRVGNERAMVEKELLTGPFSIKDIISSGRGFTTAKSIITHISDEELESHLSENHKRTFGRCFGVFCTTKNINNEVCWNGYSKQGIKMSYSIVFNYKKLRAYLEEAGIQTREVDYVDNLIDFTRGDGIEPKDRIETIMRQKLRSIFWWENEVRFVKSFHGSHYQKEIYPSNADRRIAIPKDCIEFIQTHPDAKIGLETKLKTITNKGSWHGVKITRAVYQHLI